MGCLLAGRLEMMEELSPVGAMLLEMEPPPADALSLFDFAQEVLRRPRRESAQGAEEDVERWDGLS